LTGGLAQPLECLLCKCKALGSNYGFTKKAGAEGWGCSSLSDRVLA
jgi:hypothetical protein